MLGIRWTFGIPGVHTTELFDELDRSSTITPILVTHEVSAAFMADAIARTGAGVGCITLVPAAGLTHAASGIAGALVDGVPMLVITGGIRRQGGYAYQLHDLDQGPLARAISRGYYRVERHVDVVATLFEAYMIATKGSGGPVVVEIPFEVMAYEGTVEVLPVRPLAAAPNAGAPDAIASAARMLLAAHRPGIYVGWGAMRARDALVQVAEFLGAPVATTLQGLSVFPGDHPLHVGFGFGPAATPAAQQAFAGCDCLLAVGVRFSELATGSYSATVSANLIHVDIDASVFNRNYPAALSIEADARAFFEALKKEIARAGEVSTTSKRARLRGREVASRIAQNKASFLQAWTQHRIDARVHPATFFLALRTMLPSTAFMVCDDGNHTFLAAELYSILSAGRFISPTDFNCMGYAIPAGIATKLAHPDDDVAIVVGDGAFLMSCMELVSASALGIGVMCFVFADGELGQISNFQKLAYNRKTCSTLGPLSVEGAAHATGCDFLALHDDRSVEAVLHAALRGVRDGRPVVVEVKIDYSRRTQITAGVAKVALSRMPFRDRLRFLARAIRRRL
jgi:acetolactate synthase-1/2/3 large subunit